MTTADITERVGNTLRVGLTNLHERGLANVNEAITRSVLIEPVLEALGYPSTHRRPEGGVGGNRPDDQCYLHPVGPTPGHPALVLEAKKLGVDFDHVPAGQHRGSSPDRQIQRYLATPSISGPATIGVLTDGARWRLYRRAPNTTDVEHFESFDFSGLVQPQPTLDSPDMNGTLKRFVERISRGAIFAEPVPQKKPPQSLADKLFETLTPAVIPQQIVKALLDEPNAITSNLLDNVDSLEGYRKQAHDTDWETYSVAQGPLLDISTPTLIEPRIAVAAVKFKHDPATEISRGDVALYARTVASNSMASSAVVFAYTVAPDNTVSARMAVSAAGQVNMTALFDPAVPSPSARSAITQQLRLLRDTGSPLTVEKHLAPFAVTTLRQQFYREVAQWTANIQRGKNKAVREAVLRHLIRVMFSWILKEDNRVPPEIFERAFNSDHLNSLDEYHREVLQFLFHQRLNVRDDLRDDHTIPAINDALEEAPFLNGSLFATQDGDDLLNLKESDYWSVDDKRPGLFTILSRYHWTMDEHRPGESEQTLDPELLSNLFERLIASTEKGIVSPEKDDSPLRQPQGTYYTPADIADEMVKDALCAAVKDQAGPLTENQILDLFGDRDAAAPALTPNDQERLIDRIRELRIFDPAVGSGEFLLSSLLAIRRALEKLRVAESAESIIKRQLRGQDINPLAVQIARLRLFIAITAARKSTSAGEALPDRQPLPNLEAIIVCADTLETVADPEFHSTQLDIADPQVQAAVKDIAQIRTQWFDVHSESEKSDLLTKDTTSRSNLTRLLGNRGALASREMKALAQSPLLSNSPAKADARLLFYESPWRGFDIVIGNPPYEALSKSKSSAERRRLEKQKRYRTVDGGDLYNVFCETALALAKPDGGVVTLIVPLSIAFGQNKQPLRDIFAQRSKTITLRHYDNNPGRTFTDSPTVRDIRNNQRISVITSMLGAVSYPTIYSTGLQRWKVQEREISIKRRPKAILPRVGSGVDIRIAGQWARIPTREVAQMVEAVVKQKATIGSYASSGDEILAFPKTARYFISSIPEGSVTPRSESLFPLADENDLLVSMAVLNGHVSYGWWRVFGDGFHVNPLELTSMTIPDAWVAEPALPIDIATKLRNAIPHCIIRHPKEGIDWINVDFHTHAPELIAELDRLHIAALGLPEEPLLTHLRIMRSSSSWNYASA